MLYPHRPSCQPFRGVVPYSRTEQHPPDLLRSSSLGVSVRGRDHSVRVDRARRHHGLCRSSRSRIRGRYLPSHLQRVFWPLTGIQEAS